VIAELLQNMGELRGALGQVSASVLRAASAALTTMRATTRRVTGGRKARSQLPDAGTSRLSAARLDDWHATDHRAVAAAVP